MAAGFGVHTAGGWVALAVLGVVVGVGEVGVVGETAALELEQ